MLTMNDVRKEQSGGRNWLIDLKNNKASLERWGDEEKALGALNSCSDCSDCSDCSGKKEQLPEIPCIQDIHRKVYDAASKPGCLEMGDWHTCDTTHCRAGWVVHLAGDAGYELENRTSPVVAAMKIYKANGYLISPCRFFDSNEKALRDMKRLAEETTQVTH